jgi:hypothetical protein
VCSLWKEKSGANSNVLIGVMDAKGAVEVTQVDFKSCCTALPKGVTIGKNKDFVGRKGS